MKVSFQNVSKTYRGGVQALREINLEINTGMFGLLGPNGAGKTTTVEIMEGVTPLTSGQVLYHGQPLGERFRAEAGIQFQKTALQEFLQAQRQPLPQYLLLTTRGEAHVQEFEIECAIPSLGVRALGIGSSRRAAEQAAAGEALRLLSGM